MEKDFMLPMQEAKKRRMSTGIKNAGTFTRHTEQKLPLPLLVLFSLGAVSG
jgi:hypothetical protein